MIKYEEGEYQGRVTRWGISRARTSGNPQFYLEFQVQGRYDPDDPGELKDHCPRMERLLYRPLFSEATISWTLSDLRAIGFSGTTLSALDPRSRDAFDFSDKIIRVRCTHRDDNQGEPREQWEVVRSPVDDLERAGLDKVRDLEDRFAHVLEKHRMKLSETADGGADPPGNSTDGDQGDDPF